MREPIFNWNDEQGVAICILDDGHRTYTGTAICDDEDLVDFKSEKVGCEIAMHRAVITYLTNLRDNELKPQIKALRHLLACVKQSKRHDDKNYEFQALRKEIRRLENQLHTVNNSLATEKDNLKTYIEIKNELHTSLREKRKKAKDN